MTDLMGKILAVALSFILLVVAPLTITMLKEDLVRNRVLLNEMTNFIDGVIDSGELSDKTLEDFKLGCAASGIIVDIEIARYMKVVNPDGAGGTRASYLRSDDTAHWNKGDYLQVHVKAVDHSSGQKVLWTLLKMSQPKFDVTLTGYIRN